MYKEKRYFVLTIFLLFQIWIVNLISKHPLWVDRYYVNGFYPFISKLLRTIFGWIPFSLGDIFYAIVIILGIRFIYRIIRIQERSRFDMILKFLSVLSVLFFMFYSFWGLNYSRSPMSKTLSLEKEDYHIETLENVTLKILHRSQTLQKQLAAHDSLPVIVPYSKKRILDMSIEGYENLAKNHPEFSYQTKSLKTSLLSTPLTYMGFSGYLNPFTGEAQVDHLIPKINLLFTASHEIAHQVGIASENEANFLGFLAASNHSDLYFQYAAHLMVLRYALFDIYRFDKEKYHSYVKNLPKGILKNMRESDEFWRAYENPLEPMFKLFYDHYLKYNQQAMGIKSYSQIMDLMISYDKKYPLDYN